MSFYCSMDDMPEPDGSLFLDVAFHCLGQGTRLILDGKACYPTSDEARAIAAALLAAADAADSRTTWPDGA